MPPQSDSSDTVTPRDARALAAQLHRPARGVRAIAFRCPCGLPAVVETEPELPDGTPFPTTFYLTCPRACSAVGTLEGSGLMAEMTATLGDPDVRERYEAAHADYLRRRGPGPEEIRDVSAGGMPTRVKCLHALLGHALAAGPGINPFGDQVRGLLGEWWAAGPCVDAEEP